MIKNIIFDFGDIFINLDKKLGVENMETLVGKDLSAIFRKDADNHVSKMLHQYEKGLISTDDFIQFFTTEFSVSKESLVNAWNSILCDFPKYRLDFLQELATSKQYRLFLLSNTNELHINEVKNRVGARFYANFKNCFERFYLSYEMNLRKPDVEIYEFVLSKNQIEANQTLFIDDTTINTEIASTLGIKTWNLNPKTEDITELFSKNLFN